MSEVIDFNNVKLRAKNRSVKVKNKAEITDEDLEGLGDDDDFIVLDISQMSEIIDCLIQIDEATKRIKDITGLDYAPELLEENNEK